MIKNYIYLIILLLSIISCDNTNNNKHKTSKNNSSEIIDSLFFDIENISNNKKYQYVNDKKINLGGIITTEKALSGKTSIKVANGNIYGLTYQDNNLKAGQYFEITVYRNGYNASLVISSDNNELYISNFKSLITKNGWDLLKISFIVPKKLEGKKINIYVFNKSNKPAYFDNMTIIKYNKKPNINYNTEFLNILIDSTQWTKIENTRNNALKVGMLEKKVKKYVNAKIIIKTDTLNIKLRLKGDWLDHLTGRKWSFRIKSKNNTNYWKGLKKFSIQAPETRDNLNEWVYHELLLEQDLLTTEYGFVPVKINNNVIGVYAYEEHFYKRLLESKQRREGPILKFSEDEMFFKLKQQFKRNESLSMPIIESAQILTFGKKTLKDPTLYKEFLTAQNKLYSYKTQNMNIENIFDIDKVAKYYAITDLTRSYHSLAWHNQRFYYNPVTTKFEIIAFDGNALGNEIINWVKTAFFGLMPDKDKISNDIYNYNLSFFNNKFFLEKYIYYLEKYSDNNFIKNFFNKNKKQIKQYEQLLQKDNPYYKYDYTFLYKNAKRIKSRITQFKQDVYSGKYKPLQNPLNYKKNDITFSVPYIKLLVKPYYNKQEKKISIFNYFYNDIKLIASGKKQDSITNIFNKTIIIPAYKNNYKNIKPIEEQLLNNDKYLLFENLKDHKQFTVKIIQTPPPHNEKTILNNIKQSNTYKITNNKIIFFAGKHIVKNDIKIPYGYIVEIPEGTTLDFINGASFLSNSSVNMNGTNNKKIIIMSSDNSSKGFNIIQAQNKSIIKNVTFKGLKSLTNKNFTLSGAVTFYESNVEFYNCNFISNHSEDALNVVRSTFLLSKCKFTNTYSDAFDSDFSNGLVKNTNFTDIGNDAIDFSGSKSTITNCILKNINDKGVSGGEETNIKLDNCTITNAKIAFASKDKSLVEINTAKINNCTYGFVVFTKKHEFGPAKILANKVDIKNTKINNFIEEKSVLILDSKKINGTNKNVIKKLYDE